LDLYAHQFFDDINIVCGFYFDLKVAAFGIFKGIPQDFLDRIGQITVFDLCHSFVTKNE
jgi:hypothetical protein